MITLKIPVSVNSLMTSLLDFIKDIEIDLKYFSYKPILQEFLQTLIKQF